MNARVIGAIHRTVQGRAARLRPVSRIRLKRALTDLQREIDEIARDDPAVERSALPKVLETLLTSI